MATAVRVGRLTVRAASAGLGQDVAARLRAETLITSLDLAPPGLADRAVLVVRRVQWQAGQGLAAAARAGVDELRRAAVRPAHSPAAGPGAGAVLFADEAELLACLTRDAIAGRLANWYWRRLAPAGPGRIGAVLAAAWTARARWLPAALAAVPLGEAVRAASTLTPGEAARVRQAMLAEFTGAPGPLAWPGLAGQAGATASGSRQPARGPDPAPGQHGRPAGSGGPPPAPGGRPAAAGSHQPATAGRHRPTADGERTAAGTHRPAAAGAGQPTAEGGDRPAGRRAVPAGDGASPAATGGPAGCTAPWQRWLPPGQPLGPEQESLLGMALALHAQPDAARRPAFAAQAENWLRRPARPAAGPPAGDGPPARASTAPAAPPGPLASPAGPAPPAAAPGDAGPGRGAGPLRPDKAAAGRAPGTAAGPPAPDGAVWADGVPSRFASVLYLVNLLDWVDLAAAWPAGAAPGGWAIVELLARHLLTGLPAPPDDPLWALLADLDGREPGTAAGAGIAAGGPVRLPAAWLRRWTPPGANWGWAETHGRVLLADRDRGFVLADLPCAAGQGAAAAAAELARLRAAGVSGSLGPAAHPGAPGLAQWAAATGQFVTWLLASRGVQPPALARPGRIAVTRTHVDVVLDLEHIDRAARVCGLDRDPGWVPGLGRIIAFHFEAGQAGAGHPGTG